MPETAIPKNTNEVLKQNPQNAEQHPAQVSSDVMAENAVSDLVKQVEQSHEVGITLSKKIGTAVEQGGPDNSHVLSVEREIATTEKQKQEIIDSYKKQIQETAGSVPESLESTLTQKLTTNEATYLGKHRDKDNLEKRYNDPRTEPKFVLNQVKEFAKKAGVEYKDIPLLEGKAYSAETKEIISKQITQEISTLFLNKEKGIFNPAKHELVQAEASRYLSLVEQAQAEGDISKEVKAKDIMKMVQENAAKLAMQDRAAMENTLGDHGVRHLVGHNITVTEKIFDQLEGQGQKVKAIDRLMTHQVMIDHDLGYAMSPVRDSMNEEGIKGQDAGHNLLAAKFISGRAKDREDHLSNIFSEEQLATMHNGILEHDSSKIDFKIGEDTPEAARQNIESAIHLADNTHAFEDKLPEILYGVPKSLETMRLLKVAGEVGDESLVAERKGSLIEHIQGSEDFSEDDKYSLIMAAKTLSPASYKFSAPRICGNKPEFDIDRSGKVTISVEESAIHQETTTLFDAESYKQFKKFVSDLGGPKNIPEMADTIETEKITFKLKKAEGASPEKTDYQQKIESLIKDEKFIEFIKADNTMGNDQKGLERVLTSGDRQFIDMIAKELNEEGYSGTGEEVITKYLENIKNERRSALLAFSKNIKN